MLSIDGNQASIQAANQQNTQTTDKTDATTQKIASVKDQISKMISDTADFCKKQGIEIKTPNRCDGTVSVVNQLSQMIFDTTEYCVNHGIEVK